MKILVANIGSTSFKYRLFAMDDMAILAQGKAERITSYESAIAQCLHEVEGHKLDAVAFKAVHAGPLSGARYVNDELLAAMEEFTFFAPAHNPPYIAAMRAFAKTAPELPLIALLETAFFDQLDEATVTYSVPYEWKEKYGVRRYGFHGASHRAASEKARAMFGPDIRHISCHLGGSSSMAAIRNGVAIDTSFGISPQSGLPHNNRTGDLDVFAALFMMKKLAFGYDGMARILGSKSGLAGLGGGSGDVRDLEEAAAKGDHRADLALKVFVRAIRNYIGSFYVTLGGLDVLTFSGGIGENSVLVREEVCKGLDILGIRFDSEKNKSVRGEANLTAVNSKVQVVVIPADEESVVARAAMELLRKQQ
jgi:acetate kinase